MDLEQIQVARNVQLSVRPKALQASNLNLSKIAIL